MGIIRTAIDKDIPVLKKLWQDVFQDNIEYVNLYFDYKIKLENSFVYESTIANTDGNSNDQKRISGMLYMWYYDFSFYDTTISLYYLAGLATHPHYRKQGIMSQLILRSLLHLKNSHIPLCALVPANEKLFKFYNTFGFEQVFYSTTEEILLDNILIDCRNQSERWSKFNEIFNRTDNKTFKVLKTKSQFDVIWRELQIDDSTSRKNLDGMIRIIDVFSILSIYAKANENLCYILKVTGDKVILSNNDLYLIEAGNVIRIEKMQNSNKNISLNNHKLISLDITTLTQLLFSSIRENIPQEYIQYFPEVDSIMQFMLE